VGGAGASNALPGADLSRVVPLGAGGAGSAIAHALLRMDTASLRIVDMDLRPGMAAA
jgi:shikimate dehydrogenase